MKYTIHQHSKQVIILTEKLIIDVRTREEYYQNHIKDALNIPLHDLHFYHSFLQNKQICVYCNSGTRAEIAHRWLTKENITVEVLPGNWQKDYPRIKNTIISAVNYLEINPDKKEEFQQHMKQLCQKTNEVEGFLGSKLLKISGNSAIGSFLPHQTNIEFTPDRYIIITYWKDKESHNKSHHLKFFKEIYDKLPEYSTQMPYEEFYEILK